MKVVSLYWDCGNLGGYGATMEIMYGDGRIALNVVRPYGMNVTPSVR